MRALLYPFSLVYSLIVVVRNMLYDAGIFASREYAFPVIGVGNLRVGGTGKTPMTEYLIALLKDTQKLAVLSRGYGRKTEGFLMATEKKDAHHIGDEPAQVKAKFPTVTVAVDGDRVNGMRRLMNEAPETTLVLLDDVYQHRAIRPGLLILLTAYGDLYMDDTVLPAGRLREPSFYASRADIIVVTKCPKNLSGFERRLILSRINAKLHQRVFFATEQYTALRLITDPAQRIAEGVKSVVLLTGIANPANMKAHVETTYEVVAHLDFPDHHWYSAADIQRLKEVFDQHDKGQTAIITTEKDAQRLAALTQNETLASLLVYILPMQLGFWGNEGEEFNLCIHDFIRSHQ